jgi:hypothetical protein
MTVWTAPSLVQFGFLNIAMHENRRSAALTGETAYSVKWPRPLEAWDKILS